MGLLLIQLSQLESFRKTIVSKKTRGSRFALKEVGRHINRKK